MRTKTSRFSTWPFWLISTDSGMVRKVYMLVDNRLPPRRKGSRDYLAQYHWISINDSEPLSYFLNRLGPFLGWPGAVYDFPGLDDSHHRYVEACAEGTCEVFLGSPAYLGWKNRKTPGPSLLYSSGPGTSTQTKSGLSAAKYSNSQINVQRGRANRFCGKSSSALLFAGEPVLKQHSAVKSSRIFEVRLVRR